MDLGNIGDIDEATDEANLPPDVALFRPSKSWNKSNLGVAIFAFVRHVVLPEI